MIKMNILKAKMIEKGVKAEDLAKSLGVQKTSFYRKLNGQVKFSLSEAQKISEILGLTDKETLQIFLGR